MSRGKQLAKFLRQGPQKKRQPGGRTKEANENDKLILEAAREVFVADPSAPIAKVAARAGVGIAALYGRYPSKEHLLATLCANGQRTYIAEAQAALEDKRAPWEAYARFLRRIVAQDTHALSSRLSGTFRPTEVHAELGRQLQAIGEELFERARASGILRPDVTSLDVGFMLEGIAQVRLGDARRTGELRERLVSLLIDSLRVRGKSPLPGKPPSWEEQNARWVPRRAPG
jgi:AcrR family transcriptional regulator